MDYLSAAQRRIVEYPFNRAHIVVLAAPGSGKTRTITERAAHLVASRQISSEQILVLAFSTKAASTLAARLECAPGVDMQDACVHTFHAFAARLLREHGRAIGCGPPFVVYDEPRQEHVLRRAAAAVRWPLPDRRAVNELRERISRRKCAGLDASQQPFRGPPDPAALLRVDATYRALLAGAGAMDYDDLILNAIRLLHEDDETATIVRNRFSHVFVDEFHDLSPEQYELLKLLAPPRSQRHYLMAVADPHQAIFGWRLADAPRLLARLRRDYRPVEFRLEENYRSTLNIVWTAQNLLLANGVAVNMEAVHAESFPVACMCRAGDADEAEWLAQQIERACSNGTYTYADIAVLYRTHARADRAEAALLAHGIPIERVQPDRFFDRSEVQSALRYLALVASLHDESFEPALNWPRVLVDELTMAHIRRLARADGISVSRLAKQVERYADRLSPLTRVAIEEFLQTIGAELLAVAAAPIDEIVKKLLDILARRRSPIPVALRSDFRSVLDVLARPLTRPGDMLAAALSARRPIVLRYVQEVDSAAAVAILEHVFTRYLRCAVSVVRRGAGAPPGAFVIDLGEARPAGPDGFGLDVRDALTIKFSISAQAWRLGQMLLMSYERLRDGRFVVYDLETTSRHANTAEIVEIAAAHVEGGVVVDTGFHSMLRPLGRIAPDATRKHGIRDQDVAAAPAPGDVLPAFAQYIGDTTLVGHNIEDFDHPILWRAVAAVRMAPPDNFLVDTCKLARRLLPDESHRLEDLAWRFGETAAQTHRALGDVQLNARVFRKLLDLQQREQELDTLNELLPLVALGIKASGVELIGENEVLALAGARAKQVGLGEGLCSQLRDLLSGAQLADAEAWLAALPIEVADEDAEWLDMARRWRSVIAGYLASASDHSLPAFLRYAALAAPVDYDLDGRQRVTMMTIHSAKGLEWPLVFIIGAEDDMLPSWQAATREAIDEERRVLYVGMTRARERLCLSWAAEVQGRRKQLSRFLRSLPDGSLHWYRGEP